MSDQNCQTNIVGLNDQTNQIRLKLLRLIKSN